jgi:hypothetical protein
LRDLAAERGRIGKRAIDQTLKFALQEQRQRRAEEERNRRISERQDPRPKIPAPFSDAPWLEQMDVLNEIMGAVSDPEPPARDIDGVYVKVYVRRALKMHTLTSYGSNAEEAVDARLPAPEQPLLRRVTEAQLGEEIEGYIEFVDDKGRSVHLGGSFVHHYHTRPYDDALSLAAAIATLPMVLGDAMAAASTRLRVHHLLVSPGRRHRNHPARRVISGSRNRPAWSFHMVKDLPARGRAFKNRAKFLDGKSTLDIKGIKASRCWAADRRSYPPNTPDRITYSCLRDTPAMLNPINREIVMFWAKLKPKVGCARRGVTIHGSGTHRDGERR